MPSPLVVAGNGVHMAGREIEMLDRRGYVLEFDSDFDGTGAGPGGLDTGQWLPHYLPQWSSREASRARYSIADGLLTLRIDADQPPWSPEYDGTLRVSNLQTAVRSGPVGSGSGQHPFRGDLVVREAQEPQLLYTPHYGLIEVRARASSDPHSMVALWMIGVEPEPEQSAEICVMEIFGSEVGQQSARVGMGVHPFNDPAIVDDFGTVTLAGDATEFHVYSAEWSPRGVRFYIDGLLVRETVQSPRYPMQLMLDIFHFPPSDGGEDAAGGGDYPKEFQIDWVRGYAPPGGNRR
jgi:hypothetical protein